MAVQLLVRKDLSLMGNAKTSTIVVSGVNGVGKTTSIGKLEKYLKTIMNQLYLVQRILLKRQQ